MSFPTLVRLKKKVKYNVIRVAWDILANLGYLAWLAELPDSRCEIGSNTTM
ncbi:2539_t:CDS:2 [Racocetra persica]|uniref:2539_t:CDS:1 n=1 Tax=Racocetra persica TaxID=160502 RepID=A0ACA9MMC3_9GLOM|nr:2539_t:CDS:2 [Racocetra persica]